MTDELRTKFYDAVDIVNPAGWGRICFGGCRLLFETGGKSDARRGGTVLLTLLDPSSEPVNAPPVDPE
jgi:hypothetical protein